MTKPLTQLKIRHGLEKVERLEERINNLEDELTATREQLKAHLEFHQQGKEKLANLFKGKGMKRFMKLGDGH